jgi:hypothetical protein
MSLPTIEHQTETSDLPAVDRVLTRLANRQHPKKVAAAFGFGRHWAGRTTEPTPGYVGVHRAAEQVSA